MNIHVTSISLFEASPEFVIGWWDACEDMHSDCSWELWSMGGEL